MYYKFLNANHTGEYSGFDYSDYIPKGNKPGKWLPKVDDIELCSSGYHACTKRDLMVWASDDLYIVQLRGNREKGDDKTVSQEMRFVRRVKGWNEKNLRLAATDVVEKISLPVWKKCYPDDHTLEDVIDTVRRYARGRASDKELSAARSAAWNAAGSAAWNAALSAAGSAAGSAAESAARSAAGSAAGSAAWNAALSAALSAAGSAALSAAESAARSAARSAAWSAAWKIIYKRCGL